MRVRVTRANLRRGDGEGMVQPCSARGGTEVQAKGEENKVLVMMSIDTQRRLVK